MSSCWIPAFPVASPVPWETTRSPCLTDGLSNHPDLPKLVVCHHPPHLDGGEANWHSLDPESTDRAGRGGPRAANGGGDSLFSGPCTFRQRDPLARRAGGHRYGTSQCRGCHLPLRSARCRRCGLHAVRLRPSGLAASFVPLVRSREQLVILRHGTAERHRSAGRIELNEAAERPSYGRHLPGVVFTHRPERRTVLMNQTSIRLIARLARSFCVASTASTS